MVPDSIMIFTDGSSRGNPGPGGFGAIIIAPTNNESRLPKPGTGRQAGITNYEVKEIGGREERTTNNRMELQAAISALLVIRNSNFAIRVYTDSAYLINGITKWVFGWRKNNWMTATKKPVENRDLWEELTEVSQGKKIEWKHVGGHVGVAGNERCDEIATAFADGKHPELYSGVLDNYGIKNVLEVHQGRTLEPEKGPTLRRQIRRGGRAAAYSYVSMVDGKILTHKTWGQCEKRVKGTSGAKYKKVLSKEDEEATVASWS